MEDQKFLRLAVSEGSDTEYVVDEGSGAVVDQRHPKRATHHTTKNLVFWLVMLRQYSSLLDETFQRFDNDKSEQLSDAIVSYCFANSTSRRRSMELLDYRPPASLLPRILKVIA